MALIEQDEVRRLFEGLVSVLAERDPTRLRRGFAVADVYQEIVPYRTHRNRLGFLTNQDYEGAVLGLLAGLGGYATVEPSEVQETLAAEAASPNPDTTLFREFAEARVHLDRVRVDQLLTGRSGYAPPPEPDPVAPPAPPPIPTPSAPRAPVFELAGPPTPAGTRAPDGDVGTVSACSTCGAQLPTDRPVVFCPYCGKSVGGASCARCGDALKADWTFCPRCGQAR